MKESLQKMTEQYLSALDTLRKEFKWEFDTMHPVCANLFAGKGMDVDPDQIKDCRQMIKQSVGIFSSFRGNLMLPLSCMLATDADPQGKWDRAQNSYAALKEHFRGNEYLALAAVAMAETDSGSDMETIAERGRALYERMKKEHPFLTGQEDSVFAVLLAQSGRSDDELVADMERCYNALDEKFPKGNAMQSASHILALGEGEPEKKAERMIRLFEKIRENGGTYGQNYELPVLAAASLSEEDEDELVRDILETADKLREHAKYRGMFGFSRKSCGMHAAMLVTTDAARQAGSGAETAQLAASQSALSIVIAQEILLCTVIASSAATSSSSSH